MPDISRQLEAALAAVADASRVCRAVQANMQQVSRIVKDDRSPVTVADYASQAVVARRLREALGTPPLLVAEETSAFLRNPENSAHLDATLAAAQEAWPEADVPALLAAIDDGAGDTHHAGFWTLDPIDGTKGFLRGQQYAVSLAYIERGEPVLGVLGCPNLPLDFSLPLDRPDRHGSVYFAMRGEGAFELAGDKPRESPRKVTRLDHAPGEPISVCMSVEDSHTSADGVAAVLAELARMGVASREPARLDSQAKYAVVARGQADAYLRLPTKKGYVELIWDHAAGALISHEAGCAVTDIDGHALDFSRGRRLEKNLGIVAAPPALHGKLLAAIAARSS